MFLVTGVACNRNVSCKCVYNLLLSFFSLFDMKCAFLTANSSFLLLCIIFKALSVIALVCEKNEGKGKSIKKGL